MSKYVIAIFIAVFAIFGAFAESPTARLEFTTPTTHNFGEVDAQGEDLVEIFKFKNSGEQPLVITHTKVNCTCLKVKYPKRPILSGESAEIEVKYEVSRKDRGIFSKLVQIYTNASPSKYYITLTGTSL